MVSTNALLGPSHILNPGRKSLRDASGRFHCLASGLFDG